MSYNAGVFGFTELGTFRVYGNLMMINNPSLNDFEANLINVESSLVIGSVRNNFSNNPQDLTFNFPISVQNLPFSIAFQVTRAGDSMFPRFSYLICEKMS